MAGETNWKNLVEKKQTIFFDVGNNQPTVIRFRIIFWKHPCKKHMIFLIYRLKSDEVLLIIIFCKIIEERNVKIY